MQAQGNSIRERRERLGVSIQDLARSAGISRDTLSDMESGRKDFRRSTLAKADKVLRAFEVEAGGAPLQVDAEHIAERRSALGISQEGLAKEAGVNRDTVGAIENGLGFRPSSLGKVAAALSRLEEEAGLDAPPLTQSPSGSGCIEFEVLGDFGVRVIVRGPITEAEALEESVARLLDRMRPLAAPTTVDGRSL